MLDNYSDKVIFMDEDDRIWSNPVITFSVDDYNSLSLEFHSEHVLCRTRCFFWLLEKLLSFLTGFKIGITIGR